MNALTTRTDGGRVAARDPAGLPAPLPLERAQTKLTAFAEAMQRVPIISRETYYAPAHQLTAAQALIAQLRTDLPSLAEHTEVLAKARAPARNADLAQHLAMTIAVWPNINGGVDPRMFARLLESDIAALSPSVGALETGCRKLRRSVKYLPTIGEFYDAIARAEEGLEQLDSAIKRAPERLDQAEAGIAAEFERRRASEAEQKRVDESRRQDLRNQIRRRLCEGKDTRGYPRDMVAEIEAELAAAGTFEGEQTGEVTQ